MKTKLSAFSVLLILVCISHTVGGEEPIQLFDGHSLENWEFDAAHWHIEDSAIVGEIPAGSRLRKNTWIIWKGGTLKDFDLRLQFKLTGAPAANSGIQIRCQAESPSHVSGYQADMDMGATWLGRIYDEHGRALLVERGQRVRIDQDGKRTVDTFAPAGMFATLFRENEWNDYRIVGIGDRIAVFVNGTLFSDLVDHEKGQRDRTGQLAFQLHSGPETRVAFRNIELEVLGPEDSRLEDFEMDREDDREESQEVGVLPTGADGEPLNMDFETGDLTGWKATGDAFEGQPVNKDTISSRWRGQTSNKHGDYFIGGYERSRSDQPTGSLTSRWFAVNHPFASFLIAGGATPATRVEVLVRGGKGGEKVLLQASGKEREQMERVVVDLRDHHGKAIAVRLVDEHSGHWGHLNFDDFRFHSQRPAFAAKDSPGPLHHPLLHHLRENPNSRPVTGQTLAKMSVPEGFAVDLIAAEPEVHQPMAFTFDARGRLWVVEGHSYPTKRPEGEGLDKVLIFEDTDHDGDFENRKVFIEGLNLVSGLQVGHGGVWIGAAPQLLFIPDRNHDDLPDSEPQVLLDGFGYGDTHETINSFTWGPDGWLYGNQGVFNQSLIGKPGTPESERVFLAAGVWRYHPTRHRFEVFAHGGSNQWGLDFDDHGQLFMTHCRSNFGRGPTSHVVQGGHYWTQTNSGYADFISSQPIAGLPAMRNYLLASARYGHGEGGAGKPGSRAMYGGHSHVGTMIYLGDNWPAQYRNHLFTHNLHGHRINHQENRPEGSSFNTVHAGADVFHCDDPQYIGVDLQCGPDGAVYISDWYDPRHCHSPHAEQWQRGNGRMYRMRYKGFTPADVDYLNASDEELAEAQLHSNEWHVRMARLVLSERAAERSIEKAAVERLIEIATNHDQATRRLRALWCLHGIGKLDESQARHSLQDPNDFVRAWTLQLLVDADERDEKRVPLTALLMERLERDASPLVRRYLASAAGRVNQVTAWRIIETLAHQSEIADDRILPQLLWYALAQQMPHDLDRAFALADATPIKSLRQYIVWYASQLSHQGRETVVRRIAEETGPEQVESLQLFADAVGNRRNLKEPMSWSTVSKQLYRDPVTRQPAERLGAAFGDPVLYQRARHVLGDAQADVKAKRRYLSLLATDSNEDNLPLLLSLLNDPALRSDVIRQLKNYGDPRVANALIERLPGMTAREAELAMETLCTRADSALQLLDAIRQGRVPKDLLTGFYARQMASLGDAEVDARLLEQWGKLARSSGETKAQIEALVSQYKEAPLWAYSRAAGEAHFKKLCATCHVEGEEAARIGPKLEGSGAKGIEYVVENVIDPNAVIGKDFQARNVLTVDGQVITGVVLEESDSSLTLRTATSNQTIAKEDIDTVVVSENSFMPQELLKQLNDRQRIELLLYLMSL